MPEDEDTRDKLFTWATDFSRDEVVAAQAPGHRPLSKRLVAPLLLTGAGCVAALTIVLAVLTRPMDEESGRTGSGLPTPNAVPSPRVSTSASTSPSIVPDTCSALFSDAYSAELVRAGMRLESEWNGSREPGSVDANLQRMLAEDTVIGCYWVHERDAERAALLTLVAEVNGAEQEATAARLTELGYTKLSEHGGVRFVGQLPTEGGQSAGESHFLRDGVWFATRWYGHGPYGYTADMVDQVFQ
jgi:hypothetical protein